TTSSNGRCSFLHIAGGGSRWLARAVAADGVDEQPADEVEQAGKALVLVLAGGVEARVGLGVERRAAGEDAAQIGHRLAALRHRPGVALRGDARHVLL